MCPGTASAFQSGTEKTVCSNILLYIVIYGHNIQTISNTHLNHTISHLLFLSNYDQNVVKVGLVQSVTLQIIVYMADIKGNLTNNKILSYHIYGSSMSMMVCQISLCVYACQKQQNYATFF